MTGPQKHIPAQQQGIQKTIQRSVILPSVKEAATAYIRCKQRLMDINHWKLFAGKRSSSFTLTDSEGKELDRVAETDDYVRISIPAPKTQAGEGYDWVQIRKIEEVNAYPDQRQYILIEVHPAQNPQQPSGGTAHFLKKKASSSFVIERAGNCITASVFGRNEVSNIKESSGWLSKIRNALVSLSAMLGGSDMQWKALVKGLLQEK